MPEDLKPNRLSKQKSPYLLLHAYNPIDWYPWGLEALEKAKVEDKPIFLSIGYSTCHWCHVMNRESFLDQEVAEILNKNYIAIKVDREQHPDVDQVYMKACQRLTGTGGWPLNVFLTPDLKPFFAGTYFPKDNSIRGVGLIYILKQIASHWQNDRQTLLEGSEIVIKSMSDTRKPGLFTYDLVQNHIDSLVDSYDNQYAGFLPAPKFPQLHTLLFLLSYATEKKDNSLLTMANNTLTTLLVSGTYDNVGDGLFRYATDREFRIPHFEKMLYDNAFLLYTLAEFSTASKNVLYEEKGSALFNYLESVLKDSQGGYFTAEDADSKEGEGAYYLYSYSLLEEILTPNELELLEKYYSVSAKGNFNQLNHLYPKNKEAAVQISQNKDLRAELTLVFKKVLKFRQEKREAPFKDTKILIFANGLLLAGLARGAVVWNSQEMQMAAINLYRFLAKYALDSPLPGALKDQVISVGHLDDYAYLAWGFIEYGLAFGAKDALQLATSLVEKTDWLFKDMEGGGYYSVAFDTILPHRPQSFYDGAIPEGNSVMSLVLYRLWQLTGEEKYTHSLENLLNRAAGMLKEMGLAPFLAMVGNWYLQSTYELVLTGRGESVEKIKNAIQSRYLGGNLFWLLQDEGEVLNLEVGKDNNKLMLYLCQGSICQQGLEGADKIVKKVEELL